MLGAEPITRSSSRAIARHFSDGLFREPNARTKCDCSSVRYLINSSVTGGASVAALVAVLLRVASFILEGTDDDDDDDDDVTTDNDDDDDDDEAVSAVATRLAASAIACTVYPNTRHNMR